MEFRAQSVGEIIFNENIVIRVDFMSFTDIKFIIKAQE